MGVWSPLICPLFVLHFSFQLCLVRLSYTRSGNWWDSPGSHRDVLCVQVPLAHPSTVVEGRDWDVSRREDGPSDGSSGRKQRLGVDEIISYYYDGSLCMWVGGEVPREVLREWVHCINCLCMEHGLRIYSTILVECTKQTSKLNDVDVS